MYRGFKNGDYVICEEKYLCEVNGIHSIYDGKNTHYYFIVKWYDKPKEIKDWSCSCVHEANLRLATSQEIINHLKQLVEHHV